MRLTRDFLVSDYAEVVTEESFPDKIVMNETHFKLHYHFKPGDRMDGVTLEMPLGALNQVNISRCEWLVPGLLLD